MRAFSILCDNCSFRKNLKAAHGLSLFIVHDDLNILFDTSPDSTGSENANFMNIDVGKTDFTIISHNHYDHADGLDSFRETFPVIAEKSLYIPKGFGENLYSIA